MQKTLLLLLIIILSLSFLSSCDTNAPVKKEVERAVVNERFPVRAKGNNPSSDQDTLYAVASGTKYVITPVGKLSWGSNPADTMHLQTNEIIDDAYLFKKDGRLLIFYTETNSEDSGSRVENIDLKTKTGIWKADIPGFNLGMPYIAGDFAYVTCIGTVGKLNLKTGNYVYQITDLFKRAKDCFNQFDTIIFKDNLTMFLSKNRLSKHTDTLSVKDMQPFDSKINYGR